MRSFLPPHPHRFSLPALRSPLVFGRLLDLVYPPRCLAPDCARPGAWICDRCLDSLTRPPIGEMGDLLAPTEFRSPGLGWIASGGYFAPPLSNAVRALKYRRLGAVAPILAGGIKEALPPLAPGTCIVPVPAHPSRVAERGIDHTAKLAEALSHQTGLLVASRRLIRVRATASQTGLSRELRRQNLLGAFDVVGALPSDTCLLVDDVLTTGSTALACSRALFAAGIQRVDLCVASTADRWLDPPKMTSASTFLP